MFAISRKWLSGLFLMFCACGFGLADELDNEAFGYGKKSVGLQVGYGDGVGFDFMGNGDGRLVKYLAVFPQFGIGISDVVGGDSWIRGNFDLMFEGEFIRNFTPRDGYSAGLAALFRYNFRGLRTVAPYIEFGGGVGTLDFDLVDQSDGIIFYPQVGAGFHLFTSDRFSIDLAYRLHHMSNANINSPNNSINANLFLIGFSFYLD